MGDVNGYAMIASKIKGPSPVPLEEFQNKICRVLDWATDDEGGALIINAQSTGIVMVEPEEVLYSFKCGQSGDVVTPPDLDGMASMMYVGRALSRKGGYSPMVRQLVIAASLHRGEFCDSLLWSKQ